MGWWIGQRLARAFGQPGYAARMSVNMNVDSLKATKTSLCVRYARDGCRRSLTKDGREEPERMVAADVLSDHGRQSGLRSADGR